MLAGKAIEHAVDYDDRFAREVEKAPAQIEAGQVLSQEAGGSPQAQKLAGDQ